MKMGNFVKSTMIHRTRSAMQVHDVLYKKLETRWIKIKFINRYEHKMLIRYINQYIGNFKDFIIESMKSTVWEGDLIELCSLKSYNDEFSCILVVTDVLSKYV